MNRYKASLIHFFGSACVLFLVFLFVRLVWYPGPLFGAASGTDLVAIVILADLVLGPLMTLIIFNPQKTSLKFDVACVLICQIAFLSYGVWSIFSARPVYMVFVEKRFHLVTANEIDPDDQKKAVVSRFHEFPLLGPEFVGANAPKDEKTSQDLLLTGLFGMGVQNLPQHFVPFDQVAPFARLAAKTSKEMTWVQKDGLDRLVACEAKQSEKGRQVLFLPMLTKKKILYVAVDAATGAVMEIL